MNILKKLTPRVYPAVFLLAAFMAVGLLYGCGHNPPAKETRPPDEIYESGMQAYHDQKFEQAEKEFKTLMEEYPLSPYSLEAQLLIGDVCYASDKYDEAASYYTNFVAMHPGHPRASYALFQKGMSFFKDILTVDRDQTATRKSLFAFEDLIKGYPESPYVGKSGELIGFLRRRLAERELYVGRFYFKNKNYKGALARFRDILKNYQDAGLADETLYYIGESYVRLGEVKLARDAFTTLIKNFPDSPFAGNAKDKLKEV